MLIHNLVITGSVSLNGTDVTGITGSNDVSSSFSALSGSFVAVSSSFVAVSSSYSLASGSLSTRVTTIESKYATTGSNIFTANQTICGNLTTTGVITAQTINVQQVTSSIVYSSGSNIFGNLTTDVQQMTGSLRITGSGNHWFQTGNVGIGTTTPTQLLHVSGGRALFSNSAFNYVLVDSTISDSYFRLAYAGTEKWYFRNNISNNSNLEITPDAGSTKGLFISQSGNVGIGTTTPTNKLNLSDSTSNYIAVDNTSNSYRLLMGAETFQTAIYSRNSLTPSTGVDLRFVVGTTEAMRISGSNAYVGIGTATPGALLHNFRSCNSETNIYIENTCTGTGAGSSLYLVENSSTFSPAYGQLTHFNSGYSTNGLLAANRTWLSNSGAELLIGTRTAHSIILHTGGFSAACERIRIDAAGRLQFNPASINDCNNSIFANSNGYMYVEGGTNGLILSNNQGQTTRIRIENACTMQFETCGAERMRITSGGNVGIGTNSPTIPNGGGLIIYASDYPRIQLKNSTTGDSSLDGAGFFMTGNNFYISNRETGEMVFENGANIERMRITSIGNLELSCNLILNTGSNKYIRIGSATAYYYDLRMSNDNFQIVEAGSTVRMSMNYPGGITCFSSTVCAPCFATISDYRMKSNLRPIEGLSIIMNTKPYKFEYNYDCSTSFGVIAHELQEVLPEAVFGVKDGEIMQGVDYMKLLPIAIKAIQEQQCIICSLKTCLGII
jgi:hypothetical protein